LNIVNVFTLESWIAIFATVCIALVVSFFMEHVLNKIQRDQKKASFATIWLQLYAELLGESKELSLTKKMPRSKIVYLFTISLFGMFAIEFFMKNMMFAVIVASKYERPINTAEDLLKSEIFPHICAGGAYHSFFASAENIEHRAIFNRSNSREDGIVKCSPGVNFAQNLAVIEGKAARVVPRAIALDEQQNFFGTSGLNPFHTSSGVLLNFFTGMPVRKNTPWKSHLDKVILQLHAGGLINKWFNDQFKPAIFMNNPDPVKEEPLKFIHIAIAISVLGIGLGLACLIFCVERCLKSNAKEQNA